MIYIIQKARLYDRSNSFWLYSEADSNYMKLHTSSVIVKVSLSIGKKNLRHNLRGTKK